MAVSSLRLVEEAHHVPMAKLPGPGDQRCVEHGLVFDLADFVDLCRDQPGLAAIVPGNCRGYANDDGLSRAPGCSLPADSVTAACCDAVPKISATAGTAFVRGTFSSMDRIFLAIIVSGLLLATVSVSLFVATTAGETAVSALNLTAVPSVAGKKVVPRSVGNEEAIRPDGGK